MSLTAPIYMKAGDTEPPVIEEILSDTGDGLVNLAAASSIMFGIRPSGVATHLIKSTATVFSVAMNQAQYNWGASDTSPTGPLGPTQALNYYQGEFQIEGPQGQLSYPLGEDYIPIIIAANVM